MDHRIPTEEEREALLTAVLAGQAAPRTYDLCDLIGWLADDGRTQALDAVLTRAEQWVTPATRLRSAV